MMTTHGIRIRVFTKSVLLSCWQRLLILPTVQRTEAATNVVLWERVRARPMVPILKAGRLEARAFRAFTWQSGPIKAASDPGYYGREYSFKGRTRSSRTPSRAVFY